MMLTNRRTAIRSLIMLVGLAFAAGGARAEFLSDLIDGQTIAIGNTIFFDWTLIENDATPGFEPDLSRIEVEPFLAGDVAGLRYVANGEWAVTGTDTFIVTAFAFKVARLGGVAPFQDGALNVTDLAFSGNSGLIFVREDLSDSIGPFAGLVVFADRTSDLFDLQDRVMFNTRQALMVTNEVALLGESAGQTVALNAFDQTFTTVPEPTGFATFGIGAIGLVGDVVGQSKRNRRRGSGSNGRR